MNGVIEAMLCSMFGKNAVKNFVQQKRYCGEDADKLLCCITIKIISCRSVMTHEDRRPFLFATISVHAKASLALSTEGGRPFMLLVVQEHPTSV